MRRNIALSCVAACAFGAGAQAQAPSQPPAQPAATGSAAPAEIVVPLTPEQWREDLAFLVRTLPEKHVNPFTKVTKEAWLAEAAALESRIPSLAPHEIGVGFMRLVAALGDSHTVASAANIPPGFRAYPIRLFWFADGVRIAAATGEHKALLGARLVRVGSTPIADAVKTVATTFANENEALLKSGAAQALTTAEILHALRLIDSMDAAAFTLAHDVKPEGAAATETTVTLAPIADLKNAKWVRWPEATGAPTPLARSRPQAHYWSTLDSATGLYFIQYNRCQDAPNLSVADFAKQALAFIDEQKPRGVVVDLRYNGGGSSRLLAPLIEGLARRESVNAPDRLFVLIGRQTFSSALMNAVQFRQSTRATLVGEPTGGKPNHFGETKNFTLSNSQMPVQYSTKYFRQQEKDDDALSPDVRIDARGEDFAQGRDPVMEEVARRVAAPR